MIINNLRPFTLGFIAGASALAFSDLLREKKVEACRGLMDTQTSIAQSKRHCYENKQTISRTYSCNESPFSMLCMAFSSSYRNSKMSINLTETVVQRKTYSTNNISPLFMLYMAGSTAYNNLFRALEMTTKEELAKFDKKIKKVQGILIDMYNETSKKIQKIAKVSMQGLPSVIIINIQ